VAIASALTVVALPAMWLANDDASSDRGAAPNVAAVGVDAAGAAPEPTATEVPAQDDPLTPSDDTSPPPFLAGPTATSDRRVVVVRPTSNGQSVVLDATFRRAVPSGICQVNRVPDGTELTVVNRENGRSIECVAAPLASGSFDEVVLGPDDFEVIADVIEAPVRVEMTW